MARPTISWGWTLLGLCALGWLLGLAEADPPWGLLVPLLFFLGITELILAQVRQQSKGRAGLSPNPRWGGAERGRRAVRHGADNDEPRDEDDDEGGGEAEDDRGMS